MKYSTVAVAAKRRFSLLAGTTALVSGVALLAALPLSSSGQGTGVKPVDDLVGQVQGTVDQTVAPVRSTTDGRATSPDQKVQPPVHGTNPHGQGGVVIADLSPSPERPQGGNPSGNDSGEDVVVGRARGEQRADGTYHGHITIAALFGNELLGVDSTPGQTNNGPLQGLQNLLDQICASSAICLTAVTANSSTTSSGSTNKFSVATANVGVGGLPAISAGVAEANGNIATDGTCQVSNGSSNVANVNVGGTVLVGLSQSQTQAKGCSGQAPTQSSSQVLTLLGTGVPLPAAGCATGAPDTQTGLPPLAPITCNGDDGAGQAPAPSLVRDALTVFVLDVGNVPLLRAQTASSEAVANAAGPPNNGGGGNGGGGNGGNNNGTGTNPGASGTADNTQTNAGDNPGATECSDGVDNDGDGLVDFPDDPGCASSTDDSEGNGAGAADDTAGTNRLAFTGADLLTMSIGGLLLLAGGMILRRRVTPRDHA